MRTLPLAILLALVAALIGCSRSVPAAFPPASAASVEAAEAPRARVGRAITEEPPLPGEEREGWEGLEQGAAPADHSGHHGHHGHGGHGGHAD